MTDKTKQAIKKFIEDHKQEFFNGTDYDKVWEDLMQMLFYSNSVNNWSDIAEAETYFANTINMFSRMTTIAGEGTINSAIVFTEPITIPSSIKMIKTNIYAPSITLESNYDTNGDLRTLCVDALNNPNPYIRINMPNYKHYWGQFKVGNAFKTNKLSIYVPKGHTDWGDKIKSDILDFSNKEEAKHLKSVMTIIEE